MCGECNFPPMGFRFQTYTKESMHKYLDGIALAKFPGWKREEGTMQDSGRPWVSYENPEGTWIFLFWLKEDNTMTESQFDPNQTVTVTIREEKP